MQQTLGCWSGGIVGADRPRHALGRILDDELQLPAGRGFVGVPPPPAQRSGAGAELVERERPVVERVEHGRDQPQRPEAPGRAPRGAGRGRRRSRLPTPARPPPRRRQRCPARVRQAEGAERAGGVARRRPTTSARPFDVVVHGSTSWRRASSTASSSTCSGAAAGRATGAEAGRAAPGAGNSPPSSSYVARQYVGLPGRQPVRQVERIGQRGRGRRGRRPRRAAPARGRRTRRGDRVPARGASSAHVWCWATTSVSGPIVKRPDPSSSTPGRPRRRGASRARRYSASVAAGHSWRPVPTAWRASSRSRRSRGPVAGRAAVVDEPHEPVEVGAVDQPGEDVVGIGRGRRSRASQTSGQG